ncbi:glycine--tRNA ligase subunit beta [Alkalihalobacillus trypoxylicola]|uniref:Glycine--tRNA ligase beta subunit n=1 Tax=Alkalihalobacillus trypoxylicola TaxID=519424 RepID=A0A162E8M7_9BACI|nr:glycine--tRNA ligase subunit beta [Alkalihalobacillus trypoxylicola]KYG32045.1 glycine--tRNA ligase subunit beta [Alkalihalobacillus trypoxylicola]
MSKQDFLLEIGLEELPARFINNATAQLKQLFEKWLQKQKLEYEKIEIMSTPRRLAVLVKQLSDKQPDISGEAKGPAKKIALTEDGEWSKAALGFARGQGVDKEDLFFKELKGTDYVYARTFTAGQKTNELLKEVKELILSIHFPKNMRWNQYSLRFARPIQWLVALYGKEIIPFSITDITTGNETFGHRFLGEKISIDQPAHYEQLLEKQYVLVDADKRKKLIEEQIQQLSKEKGWNIPVNEALLDEVNHLVEYPTALFGHFDTSFLEIPKEVLITSMREHQRYFPVENHEGELLPYFVTVRNGNDQHLENVARGNEKVLRARLADAAFFYKEDQKLTIPSALSKLENIVYHEELGSIADKVRRVKLLTEKISSKLTLSEEETKKINRVAEISKFDLVSQMVYEFPELQGKMGQKYAQLQGEEAEVCLAINEHYMPRFSGDQSPSTLIGSVVSLGEKMDTITSCFAIGLIPSGSQDPYALRRQAAGIVQILVEYKLEITLEQLINMSLEVIKDKGLLKRDSEELAKELLDFFFLRVKNLLQDKGSRYDVIDAVTSVSYSHVTNTIKKAEAIMKQVDHQDFKDSVESLSRVTNISKKHTGDRNLDTSLFEKEEEKRMYDKYVSVKNNVEKAYLNGDFEGILHELVRSREEIDAYFDSIMVMAEDESLRQNRLTQMKEFAQVIESFAKFQQIVFS